MHLIGALFVLPANGDIEDVEEFRTTYDTKLIRRSP